MFFSPYLPDKLFWLVKQPIMFSPEAMESLEGQWIPGIRPIPDIVLLPPGSTALSFLGTTEFQLLVMLHVVLLQEAWTNHPQNWRQRILELHVRKAMEFAGRNAEHMKLKYTSV